MIQFEAIKNFYPAYLSGNSAFYKYILKEYILLMILDNLSNSTFTGSISFIGGTSLRLTRGIDRFSEDLDFDCKNFSELDFIRLTENVVKFLKRNGLNVEVRENKKKLKAFRSNLIFPQLLFNLGLSGHRDERFMIKLECQDQLFEYKSQIINIKGCGYFFPMPVPPLSVLCSMKIADMLDRQKGRDFYDVIFLLSQTKPDFGYLTEKMGISGLEQLKLKIEEVVEHVNLNGKVRDFEHLLFDKENAKKILRIKEFISEL